jgi:hypothetical protein
LKQAQKQSLELLMAVRDKMYDVIRKTLGKNAVESVRNKSLWEGMPECLIFLMIKPHPDDVKETRTPDNIHKIYYFYPILNARKNARKKYNVEIHVENKKVTYWEIIS